MRATDQRQLVAGSARRKAAFDRRFAAHLPSEDRAREPLQLIWAAWLQFEQSAQQVLGGFADEDGVGRRKRLQPRGKIGSFADNSALLRAAGADDFADHYQTGCDADPRLDPCPVRKRDIADFRQDTDRGANGALCRILESARKAEI